ncbi:MAG: TIGR01777 family oxidoreductase [Cyclobacteriaceae bacterium]|nr:TIGR01777 family oxidoreductase [Cyclobacteriaceae bacterium]MDH4297147.1 TIGR01777 family oxidoreductase [Cyclobacteriaceae bacterium]MDH5247475.1 TIGR01777 family oxidoreductase [Cyclobacteriaceae bacterium]
MTNILITGGSGLIGRRLTEILLERGYLVSHLGRTKGNGSVKSFIWDIDKQLVESGSLEGIDVIVHLAGAGIADAPWTMKRKREILESRTNATRLLYKELKKDKRTIKAFIAASAIGYYGFGTQDEIFTEETKPGNDFLATVTQRWEEEVDTIESLGIRVVKIRTGIVLSERGGALEEIARPVKYYVGAPLGTGNQYVSWIHIDDLCGIYCKAIADLSMSGAYNGVSPTPITNREFTKAIASTLHRPLLLPHIPGFVLKLILGEMANLVLQGSKISADKISSAGYTFKYIDIRSALSDLLEKE